MPTTELSLDSALKEKAQDLYKRLGGIGSPDARIVRALWERWDSKEAKILVLQSVIQGLHNDIGLAHDAAHERLNSIDMKVE